MCAACGLWLQKFKCMRPEEKWIKEPKDPGEKKKKKPPSKKRKQDSVAGGGNQHQICRSKRACEMDSHPLKMRGMTMSIEMPNKP